MAQAKGVGETESGVDLTSERMEPKGMKELNKPHHKKRSPRSHKHARTEKRSKRK